MSKSDNLAILHDTIQRMVPPDQRAVIESYMRSTMQRESGCNANAQCATSSAGGLFQFTDATWAQYGSGSKFDPLANCEAAVKFTLANGRSLENILGRQPSNGEYYLAHFLGAGGAATVLKSADDTPIKDLLPRKVMDGNAATQFRGKKFADFTAKDIRAWAAARMGVDMDAREDYATRRKAGKTTRDEDEAEAKIEGTILSSFGVPAEIIGKLGLGILDIFMAVIKFFMDQSAPAGERSGDAAPPLSPDAKKVVDSVGTDGASPPANAAPAPTASPTSTLPTTATPITDPTNIASGSTLQAPPSSLRVVASAPGVLRTPALA